MHGQPLRVQLFFVLTDVAKNIMSAVEEIVIKVINMLGLKEGSKDPDL